MRAIAIAAFGLALAACGGGDGGELAAGNSQLSPAQIDSALGPADQTMVEDALASPEANNSVDSPGNVGTATNGTER